MNGITAKAFRDMVKRKQVGLDINKTRKAFNDSDKLRAMLAEWNRTVSHNRKLRGDEGDIIKAHAIKEERDRQTAIARAEAAAKAKKGVNYTLHELYRRILKVEKLSERVGHFGGAAVAANILASIDEDLKSLNRL